MTTILRTTNLDKVESNVLVEAVENKFRHAAVAPRSVDKQQLVQKAKLTRQTCARSSHIHNLN